MSVHQVKLEQLGLELQRIKPQDGELVVVRVLERLPAPALEHVAARVRELMPAGVRVVLLDQQLQLEHVRPQDARRAARELRRAADRVGKVADGLDEALERLQGS